MTRDFADHHAYTPREIEALIEEAGRRSALLATTEKDLVRLAPRHARAVVTLPVTLRFEDPGRCGACCARRWEEGRALPRLASSLDAIWP